MFSSKLSKTAPAATFTPRTNMRVSRFIAISVFIAISAALFISASSAASFYGGRKARTGSFPAGDRATKRTSSRSAVPRAANNKSIPVSLFSTFLPQALPGSDQVVLYASDCTTLKSSFTLGDTVCAIVSGNPDLINFPRRLSLVDSAGYVRDVRTVLTDPESISFTLPTDPTTFIGVETVDNRGGWRINSLPGGSNRVRTNASFTVSDPANRVADLAVYTSGAGNGSVIAGSNLTVGLWLTNRGPDPATAVELTNALPANTTFVNGTQDAGVPFNCTFGATGTTCDIATLAPGDTARFTLIYTVSGGTAPGTDISTSASISSTTAEANSIDNTEASTTTVISGTPVTCTLDCRNDMIVTADTTQGGVEGAIVNFTGPEAFGSCGAVISSPASGSFFPVGPPTQVTFTSATGGGSCNFSIKVASGTPPTITCPANQTVAAGAGETEATVNPGSPTPSPSSAAVTSVRSDNRLITDPYPIGTTTISWTATDADGRTASCNQTITVTDPAPVTIDCPDDITITAPTGTCEATVDPGTATATPAGSTIVGVRSDNQPLGDPYSAGQTRITWTATAPDGRVASCIQNINVNAVDTTAPTLMVPPDVNLATNSCSAEAEQELGVAIADDNCSSSVSIVRAGVPTMPCPGDPTQQCESFVFPVGTTNVIYTATDAAGNSATGIQRVTVTESTPPTITAPADLSFNTGPGATACNITVGDATLGTATANDNCAGVTVTRSGVPSGNLFPLGDTIITYRATDTSGNIAEATQKVTVVDDTAPTITAPADATYQCASEVPAADASQATAADNCGTPTVTVSESSSGAGTTSSPLVITRTYTAVDGANNQASATQTITVIDNTAPALVLNGSNPMTVECHTGFTDPGATASDHCDGDLTGAITVTGSVNPDVPGTYSLNYSVADAHGNTATATRTVNVVDTTKPVITINGASSVIVECHTSFSDPGASASDTCDSSVPVAVSGSVNVNVVGTYTLTYNASDDSGNAADPVTRTVVVQDTTAPTLTFNNLTIFFSGLTIVFSNNTVTINGTVYPFNGVSHTHGGYTFSFNGQNITITIGGSSVSYPLSGKTVTLWLPFHQYQTVKVADLVASAGDSCDSGADRNDVVISQVTSDESENLPGGSDGNTANDIVIAPDCKTVQLRAERNGGGNGRVYTITFRVRDASGNTTTGTSKINVRGNSWPVVDNGPSYTVNGTCP